MNGWSWDDRRVRWDNKHWNCNVCPHNVAITHSCFKLFNTSVTLPNRLPFGAISFCSGVGLFGVIRVPFSSQTASGTEFGPILSLFQWSLIPWYTRDNSSRQCDYFEFIRVFRIIPNVSRAFYELFHECSFSFAEVYMYYTIYLNKSVLFWPKCQMWACYKKRQAQTDVDFLRRDKRGGEAREKAAIGLQTKGRWIRHAKRRFRMRERKKIESNIETIVSNSSSLHGIGAMKLSSIIFFRLTAFPLIHRIPFQFLFPP